MNPSISRSAFVLAIIAAACGRTSIHSVTCPPEAADDPLCRSADSDASDADVDPNAVTVTVEPLYAIASDWGSYALADGSPCAGGDGCVHGGELRRARISGVDGCDGLTARDALAAFEWTCDSRDGVAFYSSGLAADRGLRDLVTNAGFTSEVLIVERGGAPIAESEPAVWWSNAVVPLPSGVTLLDQPGAVYIAAAPTAGAYNIAADGIAIVSAPDAVVTFVGDGTDNCNETTGEVESANYACAIAFGGQRYLWLEADLDYSGVVRYGVLGVDSSYVRMLGMRVDANSSAVNAMPLR